MNNITKLDRVRNMRRDLQGFLSNEILDQVDTVPHKIAFAVRHPDPDEAWKDEEYTYELELNFSSKKDDLSFFKLSVAIVPRGNNKE